MNKEFKGPCPICAGQTFVYNEVLWEELISAWQLSEEETYYINRQQGVCCNQCGGNLRSMSLARAIMRAKDYNGEFNNFCRSFPHLKLLEINTAGNLTKFLEQLPGHRLIEYPQYDMMNLHVDTGLYDLVVHSDSLEHIPSPETALKECYRILKNDGICMFTVPIVVGRMTRSRHAMPESYHGQSNTSAQDLLVHTEFGADIWTLVLTAGFLSCEIFALEYPSALTVIARKA